MSKARFLVSFRVHRDSYFEVTKLTKAMDRDQSWILNKAVTLGLVALGMNPDPRRVPTEGEESKTVIAAQGQIIRDLTARLEPKDREALEVKA